MRIGAEIGVNATSIDFQISCFLIIAKGILENFRHLEPSCRRDMTFSIKSAINDFSGKVYAH